MQGCYERNTLKTSTYIRICDAQKLRYVVEERKQIYVYILYFLRFFIYILYLFIAQNRGISSGFPWGFFFEGGESTPSLPSFGRFAHGSAETVHFLGISLLGSSVKFFYFLQWLSLSFVFTSMFVICLFVYYYHHYLVGVN